MIKYPTTHQTRRYTTLRNIAVRKHQQPETCIVVNDVSQRSVATWFRCSGTLGHYFITNLLTSLYLFWKYFKNNSTFGKVMGKGDCLKRSVRQEHCHAVWKMKNSLQKVTNFGTNPKLIYDFLLVINTNLPSILHRFRDIAFDRSKIAVFGYPSCV